MDIYVGNLPYTTGDEELRQLFAAYGAVGTARVIMDKFTGQSRGFGFVDMPDRDAALKAIEGLNNQDIGGRHLRVNESQPRAPREGGGGGGGGGGGWDGPPRRDFGGGGGGGGGDRGPRRDFGGGGGGGGRGDRGPRRDFGGGGGGGGRFDR